MIIDVKHTGSFLKIIFQILNIVQKVVMQIVMIKMLIDKENKEIQKEYLREKLNEIFDSLEYEQIAGFVFMVFESDGSKLFSVCESEGLINGEDVMLYLTHLKVVQQIESGLYFKEDPL